LELPSPVPVEVRRHARPDRVRSASGAIEALSQSSLKSE